MSNALKDGAVFTGLSALGSMVASTVYHGAKGFYNMYFAEGDEEEEEDPDEAVSDEEARKREREMRPLLPIIRNHPKLQAEFERIQKIAVDRVTNSKGKKRPTKLEMQKVIETDPEIKRRTEELKKKAQKINEKRKDNAQAKEA